MWIWLILIYFITPNLYAANPYNLGEVDYFKIESSDETLINETPSLDWREASVSSDGQTTVYTPPPAMLSLLENPSHENAKAYLEWQNLKVKKIVKAQQAIDEILLEGEE
jgi:hypothetical protein